MSEWRWALNPWTYERMEGFDPDAFYQFKNGNGRASSCMMRYRDFHPLANVWMLQYRDPLVDVKPPTAP